MKIEITRLGTAETLTISRDVCTAHPAWVHSQLGTQDESGLQHFLDQLNLSDYYHYRSGNHLGADECGIRMTADDQDYRYRMSDGNAVEIATTLTDAASRAEDWYDFLVDQGDLAEMPAPDLDESSIDALCASIRRWENRIAAAMGKQSFSGHGNYHVSAADRAGLSLSIERTL